MTLKDLKTAPANLVKPFPFTLDVYKWKEDNDAYAVAFSVGKYGRNGALILARKTGTLYAICERNSDLFAF